MIRFQGFVSSIFIFLILGLPSYGVCAQDVDTTFQSRTQRQQYFAIAFMKDHPVEQLFSATHEIDAHFEHLKMAWAKEVKDEHHHMAILDPYVYAWYLYSLAGTITPGNEPPDWAWCHVYGTYMTPAFLADFNLYSSEVTKANAFLVSWGMNWMVSTHLFRCNTPDSDWERLKQSLERIPSLMDQYLEKGAYTNEDVKASLERAKKEAEKVYILFDIKDALIKSDRDVAYSGLAAAFEQEYSARYLVPLSNALWRSYQAAGDREGALSTLNLITRHVTAGDLKRDTLQAWYETVDPVHGVNQYETILRDSGLRVLVASDRKVLLSGIYHDLLEDKPFSLSSLEGKTILFDFWTTWCGPCIGDIPKLKDLVAKHEGDFVLISISSDPVSGGADKTVVREYIEKYGINYHVLYDDPEHSLTTQFGVTGWPGKFLINDQGLFLKHPIEKNRASVTLEEVDAYLDAMP